LIPEFCPLHDISQIVLLPQVIISCTNEVDNLSDPLMLGKQLDSRTLKFEVDSAN